METSEQREPSSNSRYVLRSEDPDGQIWKQNRFCKRSHSSIVNPSSFMYRSLPADSVALQRVQPFREKASDRGNTLNSRPAYAIGNRFETGPKIESEAEISYDST